VGRFWARTSLSPAIRLKHYAQLVSNFLARACTCHNFKSRVIAIFYQTDEGASISQRLLASCIEKKSESNPFTTIRSFCWSLTLSRALIGIYSSVLYTGITNIYCLRSLVSVVDLLEGTSKEVSPKERATRKKIRGEKTWQESL